MIIIQKYYEVNFFRSVNTLFPPHIFSEEIVVDEVHTVYNPQIIKDFNSYRKKIMQRQKDNPEIFKKRDWEKHPDAELKKKVYQRYEDYKNSIYLSFFSITEPTFTKKSKF